MVTKLLTALPNLLYALLTKLGLPKATQDIVVHVAVVFTTAFVAQIVGSSLGVFNWPALIALATSAAAAGGSAVLHYLLSLVPSPAAKAASK